MISFLCGVCWGTFLTVLCIIVIEEMTETKPVMQIQRNGRC